MRKRRRNTSPRVDSLKAAAPEECGFGWPLWTRCPKMQPTEGGRFRAAIRDDRKKEPSWMAALDWIVENAAMSLRRLVRQRSRTIAQANGAPYEVRTRVPALRGRCPGPLDEGSVLGIAELRSITNR